MLLLLMIAGNNTWTPEEDNDVDGVTDDDVDGVTDDVDGVTDDDVEEYAGKDITKIIFYKTFRKAIGKKIYVA